jgi:FkbM family methyltransferase
MRTAATLKHFALRFLPGPVLQVLRRRHYARKLAAAGPEPEMAFLKALLPAGGTALDLGANFGLYTRFLAEAVGPTGRVHAVEPVPHTFDVLRSNVRRLRLDAVQVHHCAVSDRGGTVAMAVPRYQRGGENLYEARVVDTIESGSRTVQVTSRRLDDLFGDGDRIAFVKCDVEGHELRVLRGAGTIRLGHRPAWLIEVSGDPDDRTSAAYHVIRLMADGGYGAYRLDGDRLVLRKRGDRAVNYFFLRPEHVARLPATARRPALTTATGRTSRA